MTEVQSGTIFHERYQVREMLGQGSMGIVFAAHDSKTGQNVAIKVLNRTDVAVDAARFVREGRALMRMSSPHVVRVHEVSEAPGQGPYLVLERLEGQTFAQLSPLGTIWPWPSVVECAAQVCLALAEAHAAGIVHRDIKLSNLFVTNERMVKVLDFGIAKLIDPDGSLTTLTKEKVLGSPRFMSPEQVTSPRSVDARTDLWALGVVMYRLLTGRFPFEGASTVEICTSVLRGTPEKIAGIPPGLQAAVDRCLAKRAQDRFGSAVELGAALRAAH